MKKLFGFIAALTLLASSQVFAQTTKPTQESLQKLFEITEVSSMIPKLQSQLEAAVNHLVQEAMKGKTITPDQQKALDAFRAKIIKIQNDEISWNAMEPRIAEIYGNTLSQADVDGMIAFYQSPAGISFSKKMPEIMQQTMNMMQKMMGPLMEKMGAAQAELAQDLKPEVKSDVKPEVNPDLKPELTQASPQK
ncbi:DUF2059 domain-containing protein [Solimicrobium silvestre]|uniref:Uncharacterized protein conserved in bacteria (DUF2059) n=1 Tax=Solimicrobium silvestre TaxID=2099400 RepID=A0A2S9H392_9BURK|nr:DUF2059 domain-containing protein [Solimicrobium silvestre]PRC94427.1 Uncharacterized protein conserved in bacteria (DUF2059) [Solimicrobium silvestre]